MSAFSLVPDGTHFIFYLLVRLESLVNWHSHALVLSNPPFKKYRNDVVNNLK